MSLPTELLLLAWVLLSIFATGMAVTHRFLQMRGLDLLAYGAAAGIAIHGLFGLWIASVERYHRQIGGLLVCAALVSLAYLWRKKLVVDLARNLARPIKIFLTIWIAFIISCLAITHLAVRWPATTTPGQFLFHTRALNERVQLLTAFPADNSIAYMAQEFFLRHIPFRKERPLLPNVEVSMRTVLMPLAGLPFRVLIDPPPRYRNPLPKTFFGGPDVTLLYSETGFRKFLVISIALNSLLLIGIGLFCANLGLTAILPLAAILFATNPYFIGQTIFSWPKALAAFFVALAWDGFRRRRDPKLVGLCSALAYHCHPYAIAFVAGMGLCYLFGRDQRFEWRRAAPFVITAGLSILPWIVWTRFVVQIPTNMFIINFNPGGVHAIFPNQVWVRLHNLFWVLVPSFPQVYPFDMNGVVGGLSTSLAGAAGLILFLPGLVRLFRLDNRILVYCGICLPSALIIFVFGVPNQPIFHGLQIVAAAIGFLAVAQMRDWLRPRLLWALIALQLFLNLSAVVASGWLAGAHIG